MGNPAGNSNAVVTSVVARCLLEGLESGKGPSVPDGVPEFSQQDLHRLRAFSGFISKVQHNYLWDVLPHSRALLQSWKIELEVFAQYRVRYPPIRAERLSRPQKIARIADFLEEYLARPGAPSCSGLRDVLRHERIEWELKTLPVHEEPEPIVRYGEKKYPRLSGHARLARFEYDPLEVISQVSATKPPSRVKRRRCYRCYIVDRFAGELRFLELSWPAWSLLNRLTGRQSVAQILAGSPSKRRDEPRRLLRDACKMGIVTLLASPSSN